MNSGIEAMTRSGLHLRLLLAFASVLIPAGARADEVSDGIDKAAAAYRQHDVPGAIAALDGAATLLRQQRADALKALLPLPPPGWQADAPETSAQSGAMLGGGTMATRTYRKGDEQVEVQFTTDSPMLQGMATLISGPLSGSSGIRTVTVNGRTLSYTQADNGYMTLVGGTIVVKVDGTKAVPEPTLRGFVASIDFNAIETASH